MKILIVTQHFHPEVNPRSFRATELAMRFAAQGHEVTVCLPDYVLLEIDVSNGTTDRIFFEAYKTPPFLFGKAVNGLVHRVIRRIFNTFFLMFYFPEILLKGIVAKKLKGLSGYDLLISIASPHSVHWAVESAMRAKPSLTRVWVADCGDPFLGDGVMTRRSRLLDVFEQRFLRACDYVSVPFEGAIKAYDARYSKKFRVIPQAFNLEADFANLRTYQRNLVPTFCYCGSIYPGYRDPTPILDFLCAQHYDFKFVIFTQDYRYIDKYRGKSNGRIIVRPKIPRSELLSELSTMDFLINLENTTKTQQPSKLIDYQISGRPILSVRGEVGKFESALRGFISGDYSGSVGLASLDCFDVRLIAEKFIELSASNINN